MCYNGKECKGRQKKVRMVPLVLKSKWLTLILILAMLLSGCGGTLKVEVVETPAKDGSTLILTASPLNMQLEATRRDSLDLESTGTPPAFVPHTISDRFVGVREVHAVDMDGDGDVDILGAANIVDRIVWWENDGSENFVEHTIADSFDGVSVWAIDMDGDSDVDVLAGSEDANTVAWWENDGNERFAMHTISSTFGRTKGVYATDIDGDGDVDVLGAAHTANTIAWWENDGNEQFAQRTIDSGADGAWDVCTADVDEDGDVDILGALGTDREFVWWENDGNETFARHTIGTDFEGARSVYATDLDSDGDVDVLGSGSSASTVAWWENDGQESFGRHDIATDFDWAVSAYATDVDGDGDVDVLGSAYEAGKFAWWENDGNEGFTQHAFAPGFEGARSSYATDLDGDGDVDLLTGAALSGDVVWWEHELTYSASGQVLDDGGDPIPGVIVSSGTGIRALADADGAYTVKGLMAGTHTLTPSKCGQVFVPTTGQVTVPPAATGQDFVGTAPAGDWQAAVISREDPLPETDTYLMVTGDADNDGAADITIGTYTNSPIPQIIRYRHSGGRWASNLLVRGSADYNAVAGIAIGDADNDGQNELAYGLHTQGNVDGGPLYLMEWTGVEWQTTLVYEGYGDWSYAHAIADPDDDGLRELIASVDTYGYGETYTEPWLFEHEGSGWMRDEDLSDKGLHGNIPPLRVGDVDGDGTVELIRVWYREPLPLYCSEIYSVVDWNGSSWVEEDITELAGSQFCTLGGNGTSAIGVGDLDADARDEFVLAYWLDGDHDGALEARDDSVVIRVVDYDGNSWLSSDIASHPKGGSSGVYALAVGDADNDGQDEIYTAGEDGVIRVYAHSDAGWQQREIPHTFCIPWYQAAVDDVDGDGNDELILLGRSLDRNEFALVAFSKTAADGPTGVAPDPLWAVTHAGDRPWSERGWSAHPRSSSCR